MVAGEIINFLEGFHHRIDRSITGITATRGAGGEWEYPPVVASMEAAGLHPIREYIQRRQSTISEKVACHPIYELCAEAERTTGTIRMVR